MDVAENVQWARPTIRFPGQNYDAESNLHYNRFRYYDPGNGRYLNQDPIGQWFDRINLYTYADNDPVNNFDPEGLFVWPTPPPPVAAPPVVVPVVAAAAVGVGIGTLIEPYVSPYVETALDYYFGDPLADTGTDTSTQCDPQAGKRRPPREKNKPGRKGQGREGGEKKRDHDSWKPRNPAKEPPRHTPSRKKNK